MKSVQFIGLTAIVPFLYASVKPWRSERDLQFTFGALNQNSVSKDDKQYSTSVSALGSDLFVEKMLSATGFLMSETNPEVATL